MRAIVMRSLVYAGIISSGLAMFVDAVAANWSDMPGESAALAIWVFDYLYYKAQKLW
jgi:hypothetical protein